MDKRLLSAFYKLLKFYTKKKSTTPLECAFLMIQP